MKKYNCSQISALKILYHEVAHLNEQLPKVKRGSVFKTKLLNKILERQEWSHSTEEEVMKDKLSCAN